MDGRLNRGNQATFSNSSDAVCMNEVLEVMNTEVTILMILVSLLSLPGVIY